MGNRFDVVSVPDSLMPVPSMGLEMRTVANLYLPHATPLPEPDQPNLELEYENAVGDTVLLHFNIKATNDHRPFRFDEKVMEFAERVGEANKLKLIKRSHNSAVKGLKKRIRDLADRIYAPQLGAQHMIDSVEAPRILRACTPTTQFRAYRYKANMKEHMKNQKIEGITGFFKMGDELGYFTIEGAVVPLVVWYTATERRLMVSDPRALVEYYRSHILRHWPFIHRMGLRIEFSDVIMNNHYDLNNHAGEHFFEVSSKAGQLKPIKILGKLPSRNGWTNAPEERWHNVTAHDIAKDFSSNAAEYQKFLNGVKRENIPTTSMFQVDVSRNMCSVFLQSEDPAPFVIIERSGVVA